MPDLSGTTGLLAGLASASAPEYPLNEMSMFFPDYAVAALVGAIGLGRRMQAPVTYSPITPSARAVALRWPPSSALLVQAPGLVLGPTPLQETDEQVTKVSTFDELDRLTEALLKRYGSRSPGAVDAMFWLLQEAGRNALLWSVDKTAWIGWAVRGQRLEVAVGDSGLGIPLTSGAATPARTAIQALTQRFDDRGRPAGGLTRLLEHWRHEVAHIDGYILSGNEMHLYQRYNQVFRRAATGTETVISAAF